MAEIVDFLVRYGWYIGIPLLFIAVVLYVMRPSARRRYREAAKIPFLNKGREMIEPSGRAWARRGRGR